MSDAFAGTLAVCASFPLIFLRCFACSDNSTLGHLSYYAPFITIFQIGWAATQISHMALMSQLTQDRSQQTELSGLRSVRSALIMLLLSVIIVEIPRWGTTFKFRPSTWFCSLALWNNKLPFVTADAWWPALAGYSWASAVRACCDSPSFLRQRTPSTSPTTVCQSPKFLVTNICDLPDVISSQFHVFAVASLGTVHFLLPDL